jgi:hypothetical protein
MQTQVRADQHAVIELLPFQRRPNWPDQRGFTNAKQAT